MSANISDLLVISDLDGTLLTPEKTILDCDMETIKLFTMLGGRFTVASGRTIPSINMYPELARVISPAITCGGCVLYDFQAQQPIKTSVLPHLAARQALRNITEAFPRLGVMLMGNDMRLHQLQPSAEMDKLLLDEKMVYFVRPPDCLPDEWNKILFAGPAAMLKEVESFVNAHTYPGVYFVLTDPNYYEMMPKGVSKGSAMNELCAKLGVAVRNTIVIGDYYNDIDIMKQAGYAIAMGNAPDEVKVISDEVTGTNRQGGVGQVLYKIIQKYT